MLSIRNVGTEDIPLIRKLTLAIWPQTYSSIIGKVQIDYMLDWMYSPTSLQNQIEEEGCHYILAYEEDEPVGFASYNLSANQIWKLNKIYILPSQQGKGTGNYIMKHIISELKKLGATALQLQVNRNNNAKQFYEKLGFKIIDTADFDIGNGFFMNDYVLELVL